MFLTPKDIHDKTFKRSFKGYDENEVDEFLDLIIKEFNLMIDENERLRQEITAKPIVQEYSATSVGEIKHLEDMLTQAIEVMNRTTQAFAYSNMNAQQAAYTEVKTQDKQEKALEKDTKLDEFKKAMENYKFNFESLIEEQKKQMNERYNALIGELGGSDAQDVRGPYEQPPAIGFEQPPAFTYEQPNAKYAEPVVPAAPSIIHPVQDQNITEHPPIPAPPSGMAERSAYTAEKQRQPEFLSRPSAEMPRQEEPERPAFVQSVQPAPKYQGIVNQPADTSEHNSVTSDNRFKPNYSEYAWLYQEKDALNKSTAETANMDITFRNPREKEELKRLIDEIID